MVDIDIYKNCFNYDECSISIDDNNFSITFMGNGDLYWIYNPDKFNKDSYTFVVDMENHFLYYAFKELFDSIKNNCINGYYLEEYRSSTNVGLYNNGTITWYSDDDEIDKANSLSIKEINNSYVVTFTKNNKNERKDFNNLSIRICNSGSRYSPYNVPFMNMYNKISNYDYQIHIEDIIYKKRKFNKKI